MTEKIKQPVVQNGPSTPRIAPSNTVIGVLRVSKQLNNSYFSLFSTDRFRHFDVHIT